MNKIRWKDNPVWLSVLSVLVIIEVISTSLLPFVKGHFFQALGSKSVTVWSTFIGMAITCGLIEITQASKGFVQVKVAQRLRALAAEWVHIHVRKLTTGAQRVQDDIKIYYTNSVSVYTEYCISGLIVLILFVCNVHYPLLVAGALAYAAGILIVNRIFSSSMKRAERIVQQQETLYRDSLREQCSNELLPLTIEKNLEANNIRYTYNLFSRVQTVALILLPYLILTPLFLTGRINLGDFMNMSSTFTLIALNATILITLYPTYTAALASKERLIELIEA